MRGALTPSHGSPCTRAPEWADLSHVRCGNEQIGSDSSGAATALVGRSGFWELLFPPGQTCSGGQVSGRRVEKPICLIVLFCTPPPSAGTYFFLPFLQPFGEKHTHAHTALPSRKQSDSRVRLDNLSVADMFVICVSVPK